MIWNTRKNFYALLGIPIAGSLILAGCAKPVENSSSATPPKITVIATPPPNTTTSNAPTSSAAITTSFDDAAMTWSRIDTAKADMDTAVNTNKIDNIHEPTTKIRDLVNTLPDESTALPEDKRTSLNAHVNNIREVADMMDKAGAASDWKSVREHQIVMHDALDMMKGMYPSGAMRRHMHMPEMASKMTDVGGRMSEMGRKMSEMGSKMSTMDDKSPFTDSKMSDTDNNMPSANAKMPATDKMMSATDSKDMTEMGGKMSNVGGMMSEMGSMMSGMGKMGGMSGGASNKMNGKGRSMPGSGKMAAPKENPMPGGAGGMGGDM